MKTPEHAVHQTLVRMIAIASGGATPPNLDIVVDGFGGDSGALAGTRFSAIVGDDGTLIVEIGVRTHWTMLRHPDFRFARTPGDELVLLGHAAGSTRPMTFRFEDAAVVAEAGSPLLVPALHAEAIAAFNAEFAARLAEVA